MCGRAAVIRDGPALARVAGARRVIRPVRPAAAAAPAAPVVGGFFRDGGAAGAAAADRAVDSGVAHASRQSNANNSNTKTVSTDDGQQQNDDDGDILIKPGKTLSQDQSSSTTSSSTSDKPKVFTNNFNCGPTSLMPVWRLQTVEEQRELLGLAKTTQNTQAKLEIEDLLDSSVDVATQGVKLEDEPLPVKSAPSTSTSTLKAEPVIQYMSFGFSNMHVAGKGSQMVFNARSESIDEKTMWKNLLQKKRCVVLVDGFYEFHTEYNPNNGDVLKKQGYFFHHKRSDGSTPPISVKKDAMPESPFPVMHLAAVYDAAVDEKTGEPSFAFCVITTRPSAEMRKVHDRMPVILTPEDAQKWVDVENNTFDKLKPLLQPYEGLGFYKVPNVVNNSRNHGVECIEPLEEYEKRMKAQGIGRFFAPSGKSPSKSPPALSSQSSQATQVVKQVASQANEKPFFNTKGAVGRQFEKSINTADTGLTKGQTETVKASAMETSDASTEAEAFVQAKKQEQADEDASMQAPHGQKRKHEEEAKADGVEQEKKKQKPTAADRAKQHAQ